MADSFKISPKQKLLMEFCRIHKFLLASGPRYSSKTVGCLHCICDHAWRTDRGNIALVSVSQSAGLDSGVWEDLVNVIIPGWINSGMGMKWVRKPYIANVTKKPTCEVSNAYGNRTRIQLDSLKFEHEVESRFKNKRYSMMYVTELSNFKFRKTYDIWGECLRMLHLKEEQHLFLADTNPSDEGEDSWIYKVWYIIPRLNYQEYIEMANKEALPIVNERQFLSLQRDTKLVEFEIADNIFASQNRIDELISRYSSDQDLYDRYIRGLWKKASTDALFSAVFKPGIHIVGEHETPGNPNPEIMLPEDATFDLKTGMDPGAWRNTAAVIVEKLIKTLPGGKQKSFFKALDEQVIVGQDHSLDDFTEDFVEKMDWWEERMGRKFLWTHWSDRSVFDMKDPRESKYYHQIIHEASDGRIILQAADRSPHSVRRRIALFRKLLFENRFFVSRDKCPMIIEMCRSLRKGTTDAQAIQKGSKHKHVFDALMYCIASECYEEMQEMVWNSLKTSRDEKYQAGVVAIET